MKTMDNKQVKHGYASRRRQDSTYSAWAHMKYRCDNPSYKRYYDYGGKGIGYCERWSKFENFLEDMGDKPKGLSLGRKDVSKDYSPENCKWMTRQEYYSSRSKRGGDRRKRRGGRQIEYMGRKQSLTDWSKELGIPHSTLHCRIRDWGVEKAFTTPRRTVSR